MFRMGCIHGLSISVISYLISVVRSSMPRSSCVMCIPWYMCVVRVMVCRRYILLGYSGYESLYELGWDWTSCVGQCWIDRA